MKNIKINLKELNMKIALTLILLLLNTGLAVAQSSTITNFDHDDAGNRLSRTIPPPESQSPPPPPGTEEEVFKDKLLGHEISIFPNPSRGKLEVAITNLKDSDPTKIEVYDMRGVKIYELLKLSAENYIDISEHPSGAYFLKIYIGNRNVIWKVIKEE
jgi:hypothetical protein